MKLDAVEVLFMHFVNGRTHDEAVMHDFWLTQYGAEAESLIESLMDRDIICRNDDLPVTLKKLKVPELKNLLKRSGMKVSGNKNALIERITYNRHIIDFRDENLKSVYTVKVDCADLLERTRFMDYFHFNGHISIYEAYGYYRAHPEKSPDAVVTGVLSEKIENTIHDKNKYDAIKSFQLLSHFHQEEMKDTEAAIFYLNNFTMLIILHSIMSYPTYKVMLSGSHFNIDNFTADKYRNLLETGQMTPYTLYHSLVEDTEFLPYPYVTRKRAARFITDYVMGDEDAEIKLRSLLDDGE
ncbi:SAP domain-containing protein [Salinicoccus carnicancri]|uniref:SAP domain-containing protein n=1 Tax=Salinicoccus carnicancri TaxID=558170 RepID=UPI0002D6D231|nr:SAP domain-containing protein [Salinicoccus carnicancri]